MRNFTKFIVLFLTISFTHSSASESNTIIEKFSSSDSQANMPPPIPPNINIFYVDDLGWQDTELYPTGVACPWETPNISKLAKNGMLFTHGYSPAPTCSPSRGALLCGQHPAKTHFTHVSGSQIPEATSASNKLIAPFYESHIPENTLTIAEALNKNDYMTGHVGKWHLGEHKYQTPEAEGFQFSYDGRGLTARMDDRSHESAFASNDPADKYVLSEDEYAPFTVENGISKGIHYPKDEVTEQSIKFIEDNKNEPFFLYLAHWMVHYPIQTRNRELLQYYCTKLGVTFPIVDEFITTPGQTNPYYGAMVTTVDWSLGILIDYLEQNDDPRNVGHKLIENTYIIFTSDNGGVEKHKAEIITDNFPLDQGKKYAQEGGIRVPMVISGPEIAKNTAFDGLVNQLDFYPTILSLTNTYIDNDDKDKLSGVNISPVLKGGSNVVSDSDGNERESLFWHFPHNTDKQMQSAIIKTIENENGGEDINYKLYINYTPQENAEYELYNLSTDIGEATNLYYQSEYSAIRQDLRSELKQTLIDNGADYPHLNPNPNANNMGYASVPVMQNITYDPYLGDLKIDLQQGNTAVDYSYVLAKYDDGTKFTTYKKIDAHLNNAKTKISANVPKEYESFAVVVIDENNFMIKSDTIRIEKIDSNIEIKAKENHNYGLNKTATLFSDPQRTPDGIATYRIAIDVTPPTGKSVMSGGPSTGSSTTASWGLGNGVSENMSDNITNFMFNRDESVDNISNIRIHNFVANGSIWSEDDLGALSFNSITIVNGGTFGKDVLDFVIDNETIRKESLQGANETVFFEDLADDETVDDFSLKNGDSPASSANKWSVESIAVNVSYRKTLSSKSEREGLSKELRITPNPSNDFVRINISAKETQLYDMTGRMIKRYGKGQKTFDISQLKPAIYNLLVIDLEGNRFYDKLIKN